MKYQKMVNILLWAREYITLLNILSILLDSPLYYYRSDASRIARVLSNVRNDYKQTSNNMKRIPEQGKPMNFPTSMSAN